MTRVVTLLPMVTATLVAASGVAGQEAPTNDHRATAYFTTEGPRIDGVLDDSLWQHIPPLMHFTQVWPHEGEPPTEDSEVRIAYNRNYLILL